MREATLAMLAGGTLTIAHNAALFDAAYLTAESPGTPPPYPGGIPGPRRRVTLLAELDQIEEAIRALTIVRDELIEKRPRAAQERRPETGPRIREGSQAGT